MAELHGSIPVEKNTTGQILKGVLLSIFVCPGLGHRYLGRPKAFKIVLLLFLLIFAFLCIQVFSLVQDLVEKMQRHGKTNIIGLFNHIQKTLNEDSSISWSLYCLLIVYFGAPIELVWTHFFSSREK